ncbi:alpha-glucosidase [Apiospora phragmitis]|uniref:alpha-glucosidase n=1 Tax=Apiospora phragmitis TaxID=2905665 RepID=A0ABR1V076_9PEZI
MGNYDYINPASWVVAEDGHHGIFASAIEALLAIHRSTSSLSLWSLGLDPTTYLILIVSTLSSLFIATRFLYTRYRRKDTMARPLLILLAALLGLVSLIASQTPTSTQISVETGFIVPPDADEGQNIIPNVKDPKAVDPQVACPGYKASNVVQTTNGLTADLTLAGKPCNLYGNDIESLVLTVDYQAVDRLHVGIQPKYIGSENCTWFILPEELIPKPEAATEAQGADSDLVFQWANEPTFNFNITRKSIGDVLFTTTGTQLVYADQFIEFVSRLPENYNLYGLGEVIHGFRLNHNLTRTLFAADVGDDIDANIYGHHPIYYDTRYFEVDSTSGGLTYAPNATDKSATYKSYTHGVFQRNAHAQEIILQEQGITWRALGGSIDLYFYEGPTQDAVSKSYQKSAIGLPAMQQLWTFGYHQCRWGYKSWSHLQDVVDDFEKFEIPLETIWTDIDYMHQYRDFENDAVNFSYDEGAEFLSKLHENKKHYIPIVDAAIYAPNLENESDAYPIYNRGLEEDAFLMNPDVTTPETICTPTNLRDVGIELLGSFEALWNVTSYLGILANPFSCSGTGTNRWWASEVKGYFEKVKFDGIWIDMNEVSSFCVGSCGSGNLAQNPVHPPFSLPGEPGNEILTYPEGFNKTNATEASSVSSRISASATPTSATTSTTTTYFRTTPTPGSRNINWPPYAIKNEAGDLAVHAVSPNATHHGGTLEYDFHNVYGHQILNATYHALLEVFPSKRPFIIGRSQFAGSGKWAGHWGGDNYSLWSFMFFSIPQALAYSLFGIPMFGVDTCGFSGNSDMELCARWMQLSAFFPFYRNHNTLGTSGQEPYIWSAVAEASRAAMRIRYALLPYLYTTFYLSHATGSTTMRALAWDFPNEPWLAAADRQFLLGGAVLVTPCLEQGATTVDGVFPGVGQGTVWYDWYNQTAITGVTAGQNVTIDAPLGHIPFYIKGGNVLPLQEPGLTTAAVRSSPWSVLVGLDGEGAAAGGLKACPSGNFTDPNALANVTVMGLQQPVTTVELNGVDIGQVWTFDESLHVLRVTGLNNLTAKGAWNQEWTLTWK